MEYQISIVIFCVAVFSPASSQYPPYNRVNSYSSSRAFRAEPYNIQPGIRQSYQQQNSHSGAGQVYQQQSIRPVIGQSYQQQSSLSGAGQVYQQQNIRPVVGQRYQQQSLYQGIRPQQSIYQSAGYQQQPAVPEFFIPFITDSATGCPNVPPAPNYDLDLYSGRWFEIERFPFPFTNGSCISTNYGRFQNGSLAVSYQYLTEGRSKFNEDIGFGQNIYGRANAEFVMTLFSTSLFSPTEPLNRIVATDHENYSVVYSCLDVEPGRIIEFAFILGRRIELKNNQRFLQELKYWIAAFGVDPKRFLELDLDYCPRFPDPSFPEPLAPRRSSGRYL